MEGSAILAATAAPALDISSLYASHAPFLGRVIQRLAGRGPHVDDLLQETFVVAFKRRDDFGGRSSSRTWLYGIAARLCWRHNRGARRFGFFRLRYAQEPERPVRSPDQELEREETAALVYEVLKELPFKQRECFVLYELEELEGAAIAELLGIPEGTVWTRVHHARKKFEALMRRRLGREEGARA
jgi:RNA polymerase sigma-70 factor (ECF subfamily)